MTIGEERIRCLSWHFFFFWNSHLLLIIWLLRLWFCFVCLLFLIYTCNIWQINTRRTSSYYYIFMIAHQVHRRVPNNFFTFSRDLPNSPYRVSTLGGSPSFLSCPTKLVVLPPGSQLYPGEMALDFLGPSNSSEQIIYKIKELSIADNDWPSLFSLGVLC